MVGHRSQLRLHARERRRSEDLQATSPRRHSQVIRGERAAVSAGRARGALVLSAGTPAARRTAVRSCASGKVQGTLAPGALRRSPRLSRQIIAHSAAPSSQAGTLATRVDRVRDIQPNRRRPTATYGSTRTRLPQQNAAARKSWTFAMPRLESNQVEASVGRGSTLSSSRLESTHQQVLETE